MGREHSKFEFRYDQNDQLIQTRFQGMNGMPNLNRSHQYDFAGNRIKDSRSGVGEFLGNFLLKNEESTFVADPDGRGETVEEITGDQKKVYSYRSDGKISGYQSGNLFVSYHYDAFDRLLGKSINKDGTPFTNTFVHLGSENRVLLGKAGNGEVTKYIDGQGVAERLGEVKGTTGKGYITDHLGSVLNSGVVGIARVFGSFGENSGIPSISATSPPVNYGFTGHLVDLESGLNRTQFRQYDPKTGRWLSQDPIGLGGFDSQYYRYVWNRPVYYVDPEGKAGFPGVFFGAFSGGVGGFLASGGDIRATFAGAIAGGAVGAVSPWLSKTVGAGVAGLIVGGASSATGQIAANKLKGKAWNKNFSVGAVVGSSFAGLALGGSIAAGGYAAAEAFSSARFSLALAEGIIGGAAELTGSEIGKAILPCP